MRYSRDKLINYAALASGILVIGDTDAQVIYTDIDPDILLFSLDGGWLEDEGMQYIDFNFDGINDIGLSFNTAYDCGYCPVWTFFNLELYGANKIAVELANPCYLSSTFGSGYSSTECIIPAQNIARVIFEGDTLSEFVEWDEITDIFETHICGYYGESCIQGEFDFNAPKQFIGFQIIDTDTNYCWLRLGWNDDSLYINDFACTSSPSDMLVVKDRIADEVRNLVLYTDSCTGGADELRVQFKKALDEETVSEYRIMVAPGYGFSANEALLISPENYLSIIPSGSDVDIRLPADFPNYVGEPLPVLSDIKITVFSISKFPYSNECSLVRSLPAQIGEYSFAVTPDEINLDTTMLAYNSSDLFVSVDEILDTLQSSAFRIMFLRGMDWNHFEIEMAESASPGNYIEIPPTQEFNIQIPELMKTWDGELMEPSVLYRAVILSMLMEGNTCKNNLSDVSNFAMFLADPTTIIFNAHNVNIYYSNGSVSISNDQIMSGIVTIFNFNGAIISEKNIFGNNNTVPFVQPPGIYLLRLKLETGVYQQKFIVQ